MEAETGLFATARNVDIANMELADWKAAMKASCGCRREIRPAIQCAAEKHTTAGHAHGAQSDQFCIKGYVMRNFSRISSFFFGNPSISKALHGKEKDDADEKRKEQNKRIAAKNSFMGRITHRIISSQPSRIGKSVRQKLYSSIAHLLKPGTFLRIFDNLSPQTTNDKPLSVRTVSIPPQSLGCWHEPEPLQSTLDQLKKDLHSIHEKNQQNFKTSTADISSAESLTALKKGDSREAELQSKRGEQERKVAGFKKRLGE
ncbi:MAG: hypothetical protein RR928_01585 [Comamonas sp.]|uniref:hypothetical protein n=3 Tax=Comamonas sp. TaxID=34028 RepID=UPI002FCC6BB7